LKLVAFALELVTLFFLLGCVHFGFSLDFQEVRFVEFARHFKVKESQVECRLDSLANFHPLHHSDPRKSA
jgi:hypothetical protein